MTTKRRCRMLIVFKNSNSTRWFFIVTLLCAIFTVCAFVRCHTFFVESQNKIVENQTRQTIVVDSLLTSFRESIKEHSNNKEQVVRQIIADSILVKLPKLSVYHRNAVRQYLEATIIASSNELSYASMLSDLETTLATKQLSQIQDSTKSLLELEFNKIQHEYEALALWGGILTIVFLIFSFYSLFKTDQLAQQGQSALTEINRLKESANTKLKSFEQESTGKINNVDQRCTDLLDKTEAKLDSKIDKVDDIVKDVIDRSAAEIDTVRFNATQEIDGLKSDSEKIQKETQRKMGEILQSYDKDLKIQVDSKIKELNELISSANKRLLTLYDDMSHVGAIEEDDIEDSEIKEDEE